MFAETAYPNTPNFTGGYYRADTTYLSTFYKSSIVNWAIDFGRHSGRADWGIPMNSGSYGCNMTFADGRVFYTSTKDVFKDLSDGNGNYRGSNMWGKGR